MFPSKLDPSKVSKCLSNGILPEREFCDKSSFPRPSISAREEGILPVKRFLDKSRESSDLKLPIPQGISPLRLFLDKFRETSPTKYPISLGISPLKLLLEISMLLSCNSGFLNPSSTPFHIKLMLRV
ncbi:hypothetical protein V8G54_010956 [Vigna mungo]|uniref:Uncharacterized protein n=1 Tax=Vigna mungo TaxID=3915 RepID=A0AAQ3NQM4_VIGMU